MQYVHLCSPNCYHTFTFSPSVSSVPIHVYYLNLKGKTLFGCQRILKRKWEMMALCGKWQISVCLRTLFYGCDASTGSPHFTRAVIYGEVLQSLSGQRSVLNSSRHMGVCVHACVRERERLARNQCRRCKSYTHPEVEPHSPTSPSRL